MERSPGRREITSGASNGHRVSCAQTRGPGVLRLRRCREGILRLLRLRLVRDVLTGDDLVILRSLFENPTFPLLELALVESAENRRVGADVGEKLTGHAAGHHSDAVQGVRLVVGENRHVTDDGILEAASVVGRELRLLALGPLALDQEKLPPKSLQRSTLSRCGERVGSAHVLSSFVRNGSVVRVTA